MAMTTLPQELESPSPEAPTSAPETSHQGLFGWLVVAVALVAASVLVVLVVSADGDPRAPRPWYSVEHGSIAAIDHAADAAVTANRGSITAIDHAATPSAARQWYSAEHGSVTAIDHAAEAAASPAEVSAERGSIAAIDHAAEADDSTGAG